MNKRLKIVECIRQGQIGGGESHLLSLCENLDRSRFDPVVLSFTDGPMIGRLNKMGVDTTVIHTEKPFDITKWGQVKKYLISQKADLIHAHGTRANSNILWAARSLKLPVIYTVHGWSFHQDQKPLTRFIRIQGEKYLTSRSQLNISVSASNQQSGKVFLPDFESIVVSNGIDQEVFKPDRTFRDIRTELNIPAKATLILFLARFTAHKQPLSLIQAFAKARESNPSLHLLMVGEGDQVPEAMSLIDKLGIREHVTMEKFRQDVPDVLAAADIFVLPSLWEGLPIGLLEAFAMGKAVIATNVDGTKEVVDNMKNGILIDTDRLVEDLSQALIRLSEEVGLREAFGKEAIKTVANKYNAAAMTRKIEELYLKLANPV